MIIPPSQLSGMSGLARDYCSRAPGAVAFFADDYGRADAWAERADIIVRAARADRNRVIELLRLQNQRVDAGARSMASLEALASSDALAIVTGQQAGLFGGPLYTLYKALTTCKLARYWSGRLRRPVVPVFYVVSEDHDFAEVQSAGYLDGAHQYKKATYAPAVLGERMPVGQIMLEESITALLDELGGCVADGEFKTQVMASLADCYSSGRYFAEAFIRWYAKLLSEYGMIFLDPGDPGLKRLAAPLFARELEHNITVERMQTTNAQLQAAGYHVQLPVHPARPNLLLLRDGRHSLERDRGGWRNLHSGEVLSLGELLESPEQLSPKAALRPIFEDFLLPTLAYVGGPGEISYWAQLKGCYEGFGLPMPLVVPRAGFTLVESKSKRVLEKFEIDVLRLLQQPEETLGAIREKLVPADLAGEFAGLKLELTRRWPDMQQRIARLDATLQAPAEKTLQQMVHAIGQLEQKVVRAAELQESTVRTQLQVLVQALLPGGALQERQLNSVPFLCRHSLALIETLYEKIDESNPGHQAITI
jgi:bacillithiol synthase